MSGWGRVSSLIAVGVLVGVGCGGRTGALEGDYGVGADNTGAQGGSSSVAGQVNHAGSHSRGGNTTGGGDVGGYYGNAGTVAVGGSYYPTGGYATGGDVGYAGSYPIGGYGYAGYPTGGAVGYGGYPTGGYGGTFGYAGTFTGGYGGSPTDCLGCLRDQCTAPLVTCVQDFGCLSILNCMQSSGCQAFQCYSDQYCKNTIDQWGGPAGASMTELLGMFSCAIQSGCSCN